MNVYAFDIAKTLWTFYIKKTKSVKNIP